MDTLLFFCFVFFHIYDYAFLKIEEVLYGLQSKFDSHRGESHKTSGLKNDPFFRLTSAKILVRLIRSNYTMFSIELQENL
jgi:hypothetical protein